MSVVGGGISVGFSIRADVCRTFRTEDGEICSAANDQLAYKAAGHPWQCMVDQQELSRYVQLEINHRSASRRNRDRLHIEQRRRRDRCQLIRTIEYLPDDVEARCLARPADSEIDPHGLADLGRQGIPAGEGFCRAVENEVLWLLIH